MGALRVSCAFGVDDKSNALSCSFMSFVLFPTFDTIFVSGMQDKRSGLGF